MLTDIIANLTGSFSYKSLNDADASRILKELQQIFVRKNVVILGAGITGRFYESLFRKLELKLLYFTDKHFDRINNINGIPVFPATKLLTESANITAIIAGNPSIVNSISKDMRRLELPKNIEVIDGSDLISLARCAYCMINYKQNDIVNFSECSICYNEESVCSAFIKQTYKNGIIPANDKVKFPLIGYILGQICTLNCKHCCESIPYIEHPIIVKTEQVISDLHKVSAAAGFISRIEFIGGEPFLHKGLPEILNTVLKLKNVGYVVVFTNSTVLPGKKLLKVLNNPRVVVNFSGYKNTISNVVKEKVNSIKQVLLEARINFAYYNPDSRSWFDVNSYDERIATESELQDYYHHCFMRNCNRVFNGTFYSCPHQYSGIQLGMIKIAPAECIDIHKYSDAELAKWFINFKQLPYIRACKYCSLPYGAPVVEPAIQL
ncbi:MAG: radical SAM protein [Bacteroidales bacterium]|jgi:hypothetical protein|nr:radical SAM protein [Bacteroidales bacterium]